MYTPTFKNPVVIVADGSFPHHAEPLKELREAGTVICCDGAVHRVVKRGFEPHFIVGDMDSIAPDHAAAFADRLYRSDDQESNDLTKAVNFCLQHGADEATIIGATGKRDDHSLGNISLLAAYAEKLRRVEMLTDYGRFTPLLSSATLKSYAGQQVSIFCLTTGTRIVSEGLKYPLQGVVFDSWWKGTLNQASGDTFSLLFDKGKVILFRQY
ncbi:MAG: thiamine diphosphokinase [Prevotellaceae bacterium]|jgi:thiamine pyrophosphokinase|nr:thiamine diphosphokinase [Prevotellaceae bacterium]